MKRYREIKIDNCPIEFQFLLNLLNEQKNATKLIEEYALKVNWGEFMNLVTFHKVYPAIYIKIAESNSQLIPSMIREQLQILYMKNTIDMLNLTKELEQINEMLQKEHIRMLTLKGPILSYYLFENLSSRTSKDLDILISFNDLEKTIMILQLLGYEKGYEPPKKIKNWKKRVHHIEMINKDRNCKVEIHWALHPGPSKEPSFEELWEKRKAISVTDKTVYILDEGMLFYYLITHGARHGWFRIRWLLDITRMLNANVNLENCPIEIKENKSSHLFGQTMLLLGKLGLFVPNKKIGYTEKEKYLAFHAFQFMKERIHFYSPPNKEWEKIAKTYLYQIKPTLQKWRYVAWKFNRNSFDAEVLPLPRALHFLYIPLRPFLWGWRAVIKRKVTFRRL
ncbi:nucleotidyltransferase family protein [Bacillus sp. B1-b2]|uniref:nucleotidyltransferase domain-containing protein n=1 Tax=Bacillus sp. B1-b2 TaxID=2653201 RepID=UPI001262600B|nr:nucleotidyltransferase family protein [Bacillus sp. B1-b2]KAB7671715.1 nucleotidyltransferase family protein [Bacillus sp. B1-b2]